MTTTTWSSAYLALESHIRALVRAVRIRQVVDESDTLTFPEDERAGMLMYMDELVYQHATALERAFHEQCDEIHEAQGTGAKPRKPQRKA